MKLNESVLKQIIQEEIQAALQEEIKIGSKVTIIGSNKTGTVSKKTSDGYVINLGSGEKSIKKPSQIKLVSKVEEMMTFPTIRPYCAKCGKRHFSGVDCNPEDYEEYECTCGADDWRDCTCQKEDSKHSARSTVKVNKKK